MRFNPLTDKDGAWTFYNNAHVEGNISQNNSIKYARIQFFLPFLLDFPAKVKIKQDHTDIISETTLLCNT